MPYSTDDERFIHHYPRPFGEAHHPNTAGVHHPDGSWSDRCYFFAHSPDGDLLVTNGYGNNPNQRSANAYCKVALGDGRHWDFGSGRAITDADHERLQTGPMRWTCVEPLQHWMLELGPNETGIEWELHYVPRAPMWEMLPMKFEQGGRTLLDMYHMKESGRWRGWVQIEGERISVDGFHGGRDRTFGVRVADEIGMWLWLDIGFADRAIQAWLIEGPDGSIRFVDGGFTNIDGTLSKRFVGIDHEIEFDGDRKRPARAVLTFISEDGQRFDVRGESRNQHVNVYYGMPLGHARREKVGDGEYFFHFAWNAADPEQLVSIEDRSVSIDQLMHFELDGMEGVGIFEILQGGEPHHRYVRNWPTMDMTPFRQRAAKDTR